MRALRLHSPGSPLVLEELPRPLPGPGELLLRVEACGVCRTDLHLLEGELEGARLPVVPGHQIVGIVEALGKGATGYQTGQRVGVPWLGGTCGTCPFCAGRQENLCDGARFTGCSRDGGFAEFATAEAAFAIPLPGGYAPAEAAPLLCAGLIGYRTLRLAGDPRRVGIYGFGAAGHLVAQVAAFEGRETFAFTRPGDSAAQAFARSLGVAWAGDSGTAPPAELDAALIFAPVGALVPEALRRVRKGGAVVCGGIHMSEIPPFPYQLLWGERVLRSVANLTRQDGRDFFALAARARLRAEVQTYPLERGMDALEDLRLGRLQGAGVLLP
ncbi:MAG: zinc-dependent alcohol dehydrogenase family protein [Acidobacteria bacterium]|nr:zinc-dependent alcohol dehydrogenase family protein [Acidobacteriota bacterium]